MVVLVAAGVLGLFAASAEEGESNESEATHRVAATSTESIESNESKAQHSSAATSTESSEHELPQDIGVAIEPPSVSVTINLINKLVERGILEKGDAEDLVRQARAEAEVARAQIQADVFATAQVAVQRAVDEQLLAEQLPEASEGDVRVSHIPAPVRRQLKEDIKAELREERRIAAAHVNFGPGVPMGEKRTIYDSSLEPYRGGGGGGDLPSDAELLASFGYGMGLPGWVSRLNLNADLRVRYEAIFMSDTNDSTGAFPDFNAINTGAPYDITGYQFAPQLNSNQDRQRFRIRARAGLNMDLQDGWSLGFRMATGNDGSPVSTNQTLGATGGFSKYSLWLDRAYLQYAPWDDKDKKLKFTAGRFANPYFTTNLVWDDNVNFDGLGVSGHWRVLPSLRPFFAASFSPVYNTALNFPANQPEKYKSDDKWLAAIQLGTDWAFADKWNLKAAVGYYHFENIEGKLSSPFVPLSASDAGDTDNSRPMFAQKGNTYRPIRNIKPDPANNFGHTNQWQYYGLATKFQELTFTGRIDYNGFEPVQVSLVSEFVANLAWNRDEINKVAVNNRKEVGTYAYGDYDGYGYGWLGRLEVGHPKPDKRGNWKAYFEYRWLGSDATVDGFADSTFGLGGTNMQGFTVGASYTLSPNVNVNARWMASDNITGPKFSTGIFQFDLSGEF